MTPSVSVVLPGYNHERFLAERVESILAQSFQDFELILLDDASTDGSRALLERYSGHPRVSALVANPRNSGSPFRQWARGVALARGEWVWIAESDDVAAPGLLDALVARAERGVALVFCRSRVVDEEGRPAEYLGCPELPHERRWPGLPRADTLLPSEAFVTGPMTEANQIANASAVLFRRAAFPVDDRRLAELTFCGDWYAWVRVLEHGDAFYVHEALNRFRVHSGTVRAAAEGNPGVFVETVSVVLRILRFHRVAPEARRRIGNHLVYIYRHRFPARSRAANLPHLLHALTRLGLRPLATGVADLARSAG